MIYNTNTIVVLTSLIAATSAFAGNVVVGQNNKLDLAPVIVAEQSLPTAKVGQDANKDNGALSVTVSNGIGVTVPFVNAEAKLGSVSVGPKELNVTVGNSNSVTVGPVKVGQNLPTASIGTGANKNGWFDIRLKGGLGITLPFISVDVPCPTLNIGTGKSAAKK